MLQKDYIMRLIQQLTRVLLKILFNVENKNFDAAQKEVDRAYAGLTGIDATMINSMSAEDIILLLSRGKKFEAEKCMMIAKLLKAEGDILDASQRTAAGAIEKYHKSLNLFLELYALQDELLIKNFLDDLPVLINKTSGSLFDPGTKYKILCYYEHAGQYDKAENILFELAEINYPGIVEQGHEFYKRLLQKNNEDLIDGNLPREELLRGMKDLEDNFS